MAADWWDEWVLWHTTRFGMSGQDAATLMSWGDQWTAVYREDELREASLLLHMDPAASPYADKQRGQLIQAVDQVRRKRLALATAHTPDAEPAGRCEDCDDSGFVPVPHPGTDPDTNRLRPYLKMPDRPGQPQYTTVVVCHCLKGSSVRSQDEFRVAEGKVKAARMTLARYEALYPNWRQVKAAFDAQRRPPARTSADPADLAAGIGRSPYAG